MEDEENHPFMMPLIKKIRYRESKKLCVKLPIHGNKDI